VAIRLRVRTRLGKARAGEEQGLGAAADGGQGHSDELSTARSGREESVRERELGEEEREGVRALL
jgi:hypothetical protein